MYILITLQNLLAISFIGFNVFDKHLGIKTPL